MTDKLDSRTTGTVTAFMDESEHPLRRSTFTPAEGVTIAPETADVAVLDVAEPEAEAVEPEREATEPEAAGSEAPELEAMEAPEATEPDLGFPKPPERGSLDDDDLVPLVGRHTEDTATVDLIGILQAQMHLRTVEAARFAEWESQIRRIGTEEALDELERTRLHFTGVIPVQTGPTIVTTAHAPAGSALVPERISAPEPEVEAGVIPAGTAPSTAPEPDSPLNAHVERARIADDELLEHGDEPQALDSPKNSGRRITAGVLSILALVVVAGSLVLFPLGASATLTAAVATVGVVAAAWIGIVAGRLALRARARVTAPVSSRTVWALVAGLVVGTAVGEGLVRTSAAAFAWQGYLLRLVSVQGLHVELSLVAGLAAALVLAFVIVVLVDRARVGTTTPTAFDQDHAAN